MNAKLRKPYPSDLSDEQWAIVEPLLPTPVKAGAPRKTDLREVLNAIFYVLSTACAWSALPHDFPPEGPVRFPRGLAHARQRRAPNNLPGRRGESVREGPL